MTWKTHSQGIMTSSIILYPLVTYEVGQMNLDTIHATILCLCLYILIHASARFGTIFCDLDAHSGAIPQKSGVTLAVNKLLHFVFRGRYKLSHRSWQTHSVDLYVIFTGLPSYMLYSAFLTSGDIIYYLGAVVLLAFCIGAIIHCFMDMFTTKGVWLSIVIAYVLSIGKPKGSYKQYRVKLAPTWFWYPAVTFRDNRGRFSVLPRLTKCYPITDTSTGGEYEDGFRGLFIQLNYLFLMVTIFIYVKSTLLP